MSAYDQFLKESSGAGQPSLPKPDAGGTTQPAAPARSAYEQFQRDTAAPVVTPANTAVTKAGEKKGIFDTYAENVNRKIASFDAGFLESVGQLSRSFQWLSDRVVADPFIKQQSEQLQQTENKTINDLYSLYNKAKAAGKTAEQERLLKIIDGAEKSRSKYEGTADTKSFFTDAQVKTKEWAETLRRKGGITPENQTFLDRVFEGAGSSATFFVPGIGVAKGANVLAQVSPRIALLFGGSAAAGLEAMAEAGSVYDEVSAKEGKDKAVEASSRTFLANSILLTISNSVGAFNPATKGVLKKALLSASSEGLQEAAQQMIQNQQTGKPLFEGVAESGAIGAIVGSVMGGATDIVMDNTEKAGGNRTEGAPQGEEGQGGTPTQQGEPKSAYQQYLEEKGLAKPAVELQKEVEAKAPLPSPTNETAQNQAKTALPVGEGSGLPAGASVEKVEDAKLFNGSAKKVTEETKSFEKTLVFPDDQKTALRELAEAGDAEAKAVSENFSFVAADKLLRERYGKEYDAIIFNNAITEPRKGREYFDLSTGRFWTADKTLAELYAMQNRGAKYETTEKPAKKDGLELEVKEAPKDGSKETAPAFSKSDLKKALANSPEFKANAVLTVEGEGEYKRLVFRGEKTKFSIKPSALGLNSERLTSGDRINVSPENLKAGGKELQVTKYEGGKGSRYASIGKYREDTEITLGNIESVQPIEFPELLDLAKELSGNVPFIKKYSRANGMFYGKGGGEIGLNPDLFKRENLGQLQKTFAHEIGHLIDYLPDGTLTRGNVLGRLASLKGFQNDFYEGTARSNKELREQMWNLSKYWKPIDEAAVPASFLAYRKSSAEIYADFISVLFNNPKLASDIAPSAYNLFFDRLDAKPEVKRAYFELQDFLRNGGNKTAKRRTAVNTMFKNTEAIAREKQIENEMLLEEKKKSIFQRFKLEYVDQTDAMRELVAKAKKEGREVSDDQNPNYFLEETKYLGGKIKSEVDEKFNGIYQELQKNGMAWEDLGELMFYERILKGDRQEIANPLGYQPDFVKDLMEVYEDVGTVKPDQAKYEEGTGDMRSTLGEEKFAKLQELANLYRENLKGFFVEGREEGIYTPELEKLFTENAFYVPFKGAKYSGVTKTTFGVKSQKGTLGDIENPANTGIEKAVSIIKAIERNRVNRAQIEFLEKNFPSELQEAALDKNGYPMEPRDKSLGLMTYMKDGKVKGFYVDKYIAESTMRSDVGQNQMILQALKFLNSKQFRPLFITFNTGFQAFNVQKDFWKSWKAQPDASLLDVLRSYKKALLPAKVRAFGVSENASEAELEADRLIKSMEKERMLGLSYNDVIKGESLEDQQIERILREVGVREYNDKNLGKIGAFLGVSKDTPVIKQAVAIMDFIEKTGNMLETLPKVAGKFTLEGKMEPRELASYIRKNVGSPDFNAGGRYKPVTNEVFLFSNAIIQGMRSDIELATDPKTRSSYWYKTAKVNFLPKILMMMATAGLFGEYLKELFANVSEYDKTNYTIIPLGKDENGKTIYFRMPQDEAGRLLSGLLWKTEQAAGDPEKLKNLDTYTNILAYAGGQAPSVSPAVTAVFNTATFVSGNNPYDYFRNRPVLTDEQMQAGGMEKLKPFLAYMFEQLGGSVFMKLYSNETVPRERTLGEKIIAAPVLSNVLGRFIKISNYGQTEKIRELTGEVRTQRSQEAIANRKTVFEAVQKAQGKSYQEGQAIKREMVRSVYGGAPKTPEDRTQAKALERRFDLLRLRGQADPKIDSLLTSKSTEETVALLESYKETMSAKEFGEFRQFIIKNKVVSSAAFQAFLRVDKK